MTRKKAKARITHSDFSRLKKELKALNPKWVNKLVETISVDDTKDDSLNDVNEKKIYNIFNGQIKNGAWRAYVYKRAKELKTAMQIEIEEAIK